MIALWVLGGIGALIGVLCCIPVGVTAEYSQQGPNLVAHAGPVRILLYPRPKKKSIDKKAVKSTGKSEKRPDTVQKPKEKRGGSIAMFRELIGLVLEGQAEVRNKLRIRELTLHLTVGGKNDDPAKSAMLYGSAWAAIGSLMPLLERAFRIEQRDVQAFVDFLSEETTVYAKATAVISVGAILRMGVYYGVRGLKLYRKHMKKGGKNHGTSNQ